MIVASLAAFILGSTLFPQAAFSGGQGNSEGESYAQTASGDPTPGATGAPGMESREVGPGETGGSPATGDGGGGVATGSEDQGAGGQPEGEVNPTEGPGDRSESGLSAGNTSATLGATLGGSNAPWKVTSLDIWKDVDAVYPVGYEISLDKSAEPPHLEMEVGDEEEATFTITVGIDGNPNTFHIEGDIFVKNTGDWPADVTSVSDTVWYKAGDPDWLPATSSISTTVPTGTAAIPTGGPHGYSYSGTFILPVSLDQVTSLSNLVEITISNKPDPPPPGMKSHTFHYRKDFSKPSAGAVNPILVDEESVSPATGLDYKIKSTTINGAPAADLDGPWELDPRNAPYTIVITKSLTATAPGTYTLLNKARVDKLEDPAEVEIVVREGEPACGSLEGSKYEDVNGNGQLDEGDGPWEDVIIQLWWANGQVAVMNGGGPVAETLTDENGRFAFACLEPGTYMVTEVLPQGSEPVGSTTRLVEVAAGETATVEPPFLNRWSQEEEKGEIEGWKYLDANGDGTLDEGEEGLPGVTMRLYTLIWSDFGTSRVSESLPGPVQVAETVTGEGGYFSFTGLEPGDYMVQEEVPEGYYPTSSGWVQLSLEGDETARVFFLNAPMPRLTGEKIEYPSDEPVEGVEFALTPVRDGGQEPAIAYSGTETRVTGPDGTFDFGWLMPGSYSLEEKIPEGWEALTDPVVELLLGPGDDVHLVFINRRVPVGSSLSGFKWLDANGDGVHQATEPPVEGVLVTLEGPDGYTAGVLTDENGLYVFDGLPPGNYLVRETVPAGSYPTTSPEATTTLEEGETERVDFLNAPYGQVWGLKWNDLDGNGSAGSDEGNLAGVTIRLKDSRDEVVLVAETLVDGSYSFPELQAGIYTVEEIVPFGYESTAPTARTLRLEPGETERVDFFNRVPVAGEIVTPPLPGPPSVTPAPTPAPKVAGQTLPVTGAELALVLAGAGLLAMLGLGLILAGAKGAGSWKRGVH